MKLTKYMKETFVEAVMQDVPKVNNHNAMQKILNDAISASNLPDVNILYDRHPGLFEKTVVGVVPDTNKLDHYNWENSREKLFAVSPHHKLNAGSVNNLKDMVKLNIITQDQRDELIRLLTDERNNVYRRETLKDKLEKAIIGCDTLEQLKDAFPEFERYMSFEKRMQADNKTQKQEPATENLVADFVAAGWPKDKEQAND